MAFAVGTAGGDRFPGVCTLQTNALPRGFPYTMFSLQNNLGFTEKLSP